MNVPSWLLRLLPLWEHVCPRCRRQVKRNSHQCPHCREKFPLALKVPPSILGDKAKLEAYVHAEIFPRISQSQREYLTQFFTTFFQDGFESGNFSAWTGTIGSPTIVTSPVNSGTYAMKMAAYLDGVYENITPTSVVHARCYIYFSSFVSAGNRQAFLYIYNSALKSSIGASLVQAEVLNNAGTVQWQFVAYRVTGDSEFVLAPGPLPQLNMWYCVELAFNQDSLGGAQMWINGSSIGSISGTTANYVANEVDVYQGLSAVTMYADDVVIADAYIGTLGISGTTLDGQSLTVTKWDEEVDVQDSEWDAWSGANYKHKVKVYGIIRTYTIDCIENGVAWTVSLANRFETTALNGTPVIFYSDQAVRPVSSVSVFVMKVTWTLENIAGKNVRKFTLTLQEA